MELYWKCAAGALVGVVLMLTLGRKDLGLALSLTVCAMVSLGAMAYLEPVVDLIRRLEELGSLNSELLTILFKAVGLGLITELAAMVCTDSGNASLARALQLLGTAAVLWLSLPLFEALLALIGEILEGL